MSDRDLKLLIRIIKFMQQHPQASNSQHAELDDIDERLSALLNAEISEENIEQKHRVQNVEKTIQAEEAPVKSSSNVDNEVFDQLTEENEALKEQVTSMSEMMEMTLKHVDSQLDDRLDQERKLFKEIEENLQEQIVSQQEVMEMTFKHIEANVDEKFDEERKAFKEIEENLQEQIIAQQGMMEMTLKNIDLAFEEKIDDERKTFKEIEEGLQEEIHSQQEMMEMTIRHLLQTHRSEAEVDEILKEYKAIEENLQEEILSQQEMMEMTIGYLQSELSEKGNAEQNSASTEQTNTDSAEAEVAQEPNQAPSVEETEQKEEVAEKQVEEDDTNEIEEQKNTSEVEVTIAKVENANNDTEAQESNEISQQDEQSLEVAHKVFKEYMDLPSKLDANFKHHFLAEFMHEGNSRSYLYVRPLRSYTVIVVVDSLLKGVSSIVFNSLSSMLLHHLIVERRIEGTADLVAEFMKGTANIYDSIGEEARDTQVSVLNIRNKTLEIEFSSTEHELFYAQKDKYRLLQSGKNEGRKMNEQAYKVSKINGRKGAVVYMVSQPMDTVYEKPGGGNFMSLQEMLINTYQLDFTEHKDNLSGYMQELQPENQVDNTLIFGLNL